MKLLGFKRNSKKQSLVTRSFWWAREEAQPTGPKVGGARSIVLNLKSLVYQPWANPWNSSETIKKTRFEFRLGRKWPSSPGGAPEST